MDEFLERIYLDQAQKECEACLVAVQAFNSAPEKENEDPFVYAMTFIHRAASVSRIFWPPGGFNKQLKKRSQQRGHYLRGALEIGENHPIQSRTLRDHFEHFDERLDDWAEKSKNRVIIGALYGDRSTIEGVEDDDIILHYDPATKIFAFRGEKFDMQNLVDGIVDILSRIQTRQEAIKAMRFKNN